MIVEQGVNEVLADFTRAARRARPEAERITRTQIGNVSSTMRTLAPEDEGELIDGIHDDVFSEAGKIVGESGSSARHQRFVEYGTYKDAPQAHAGPALDRHSGDYVQELEELAGDI